MTNADKYLKDGVGIKEFLKKMQLGCGYTKQEGDMDYLIRPSEIMNWLNSDVKPTLTEDEKVILRNVQMQFTLISRDEHTDAGKNDLYITDDYGEGWTDFSCFNHLFQFIKPRRRI